MSVPSRLQTNAVRSSGFDFVRQSHTGSWMLQTDITEVKFLWKGKISILNAKIILQISVSIN